MENPCWWVLTAAVEVEVDEMKKLLQKLEIVTTSIESQGQIKLSGCLECEKKGVHRERKLDKSSILDSDDTSGLAFSAWILFCCLYTAHWLADRENASHRNESIKAKDVSWALGGQQGKLPISWGSYKEPYSLAKCHKCIMLKIEFILCVVYLQTTYQ